MTIQNALNFVGRQHTQKDRQIIGYKVQQIAAAQKVNPKKVKQQEGDEAYLVNDWPTSFESVIFSEIDKYFLPKQAPAKLYQTNDKPSMVSDPQADWDNAANVGNARPKRPRIKREGGNG